MWFQVHYPPLVGVLPIFRSRYWYAIGRQGVLSLAGWAPQLRAGFHVSGPTQEPGHQHWWYVRDYHPLWSDVPDRFRPTPAGVVPGPTTPPGRVRGVWADPRSLAATDGV